MPRARQKFSPYFGALFVLFIAILFLYIGYKVINKVFLVGSEFYKVRNKESKLLFFETKYDFEKYLKSNDIKENNILIKGSRGMKMEEIVKMF